MLEKLIIPPDQELKCNAGKAEALEFAPQPILLRRRSRITSMLSMFVRSKSTDMLE